MLYEVITQMLNYEQIKNRPRILSSLTGLTPAAFAQLGRSFNRAYQQELADSDHQREQPRQRQRGGGRKAVLQSSDDKLRNNFV